MLNSLSRIKPKNKSFKALFRKPRLFLILQQIQAMAKFYSLPVRDIRRETDDCVSVAFDIPAELLKEYTYTQGQYLTIRMQHGGEEIRRSYSLCSSPVADTDVRIAAKQVKDGRMSVYLNQELKVGDVLDVMTPMGNFYSLTSVPQEVVMFAGGSGITPMLSIIKTLLKQSATSNMTLIYGNQNEASIIFNAELKALAAANAKRFKVIDILDQAPAGTADLYKGILTKEKVLALIENHVGLNLHPEFFICGPGAMMKNVEESLLSLSIPKNKIHLEYFTATLNAEAPAAATSTENITAQVTVLMDGSETHFELATAGKSILDAAMDMDVDVPFSCKGAVCCTCRAKVIEGTVMMTANYALTEEEVEEGFILTCQAHPTSAKVVIDYDV